MRLTRAAKDHYLDHIVDAMIEHGTAFAEEKLMDAGLNDNQIRRLLIAAHADAITDLAIKR